MRTDSPQTQLSGNFLRTMTDQIPILAWSCRPDGATEFLNQRWLDYTGLAMEDALGWGWKTAIHPEDLEKLMGTWLRLLASAEAGQEEARLRRFDGEYRWFLFRAVPLRDEAGQVVNWYGTNTDIEGLKRAEALLAGENRLLEMMARGCLLGEILDALCRLIEDSASGTLCGIVLVDRENNRLEHGAAPSLPLDYIQAIHGRPIDLYSGPCAMAVYLKEQVIADDVASDTRWDSCGWCTLAMTHGLHACWSTPILSADGSVLGTFAIYWRLPGRPTAQHQNMIAQVTHLAAIAIEHKQAEEKLRQRESELQQLVDAVPHHIFVLEPDGSRLYSNQVAREYHGLSANDPLADHLAMFVHPDEVEGALAERRRLIALGAPYEMEVRLRDKDGRYRWFLIRGNPLRDPQGRILRWYGTRTDIEDRKRAEALLAGENRLLEMMAKDNSLAPVLDGLCRLVEDLSPGSLASILLLDGEGERLWHGAAPSLPKSYTEAINGGAIGPAAGSCGTAAYRAEPVIVADIATDPLWADYRELALAHGLRACWSTPILSSAGIVLGTFAIYWREPQHPTAQHHKIIEQFTHLAAVAIERERTEQALHESDERLRQMADNIPEVIWIAALEPEKVLYVSPSFERVWGRPVEELYRNPHLWTEMIHPEDRERVVESFARWIAGEQVDYHDVEYRIIQANGSTRWIHERGVRYLDNHGKVYRVSGISTDITERKRAEQELRRSEAYLAEAQRLSLTGSFGWKVSSGELFWSKETFCIVGYGPGVKPTLELVLNRVHPEDRAFVQQTIDRASSDATDLDFEHRLLFSDGALKHVHVRAHAVRDESGTVEFVGAVSDVTSTKLAEEKIRQSERELRRIVDLIPQIVVVIDSDGLPLYANRVMLDYTGVNPDEVPSVGFGGRLSHAEDVEKFRAFRQESLAQSAPFQFEQRMLGKDGVFRWFLFRYNPLKDDAGNVARWYVTATDIHDRRETEERIQKENLALREEIDHSSMFEEIVGSSRPLRGVLTQVTKVAPLDATVLILGETGTGKELIARAIHKRSKRAPRAFVRVNCASIPQPLIASELFGHEKGAFTGALQRRLGRFELADGGTIFLDEIGELPAETQIALLRVLQEREFERVGGSQTIAVDVRVLAATNRDLKAAVAAGTFRQDLFYRLNVFPIQMPSLRERVDDIPLLVEYFIERYGKKVGKKIRTIRKQTLELFQEYDWPGNIRELQNVIERAVVLCDSETFSVDETWLKRDGATRPKRTLPFVANIVEQEKEMIQTALAASRGRIAGPAGAAAKLGIPRQTLESKIKSLGIDKHRFKAPQAH